MNVTKDKFSGEICEGCKEDAGLTLLSGPDARHCRIAYCHVVLARLRSVLGVVGELQVRAVAHRHRYHRTRLVVALSAGVLDAVVFDPPHRVPRAVDLRRYNTSVSGVCQANVNYLSLGVNNLLLVTILNI